MVERGAPSMKVMSYYSKECVFTTIPMIPFYANIIFKDNENEFLFDPFSGYLVKDEK